MQDVVYLENNNTAQLCVQDEATFCSAERWHARSERDIGIENLRKRIQPRFLQHVDEKLPEKMRIQQQARSKHMK